MLTNEVINKFEDALDFISDKTGYSIEEIAYMLFNQNIDLLLSKNKLNAQDATELYNEMQLANDLKNSCS